MSFLKNVFITLLFVATTSTSYQLNAMEKEMTAMLEKPVASDLQIYQLLSAITKDNSQLYLPHEVTQIIALNACEITEKLRADCYKKYGKYIETPDSILTFIEDCLKKTVDHTDIVTILKTCLSYSGKSLSEIKDSNGDAVIHNFILMYYELNLDCIKIIFLVTGNQAWDLITIKNIHGNTALYYELYYQLDLSAIKDLLRMAPSPEQAWSLINTPNDGGKTALSLATQRENKEVIEILESYRPKEQ